MCVVMCSFFDLPLPPLFRCFLRPFREILFNGGRSGFCQANSHLGSQEKHSSITLKFRLVVEGAQGGSAHFLKFWIVSGNSNTFEKSIIVSPSIVWLDHHNKRSTLSHYNFFSQFVVYELISSLT